MIKKFIYAFVFLTVLFLVFVFGVFKYTRNRFSNNVFIDGVDVSYLKFNDARDLLNSKVSAYLNGKINVSVGDESVDFFVKDLGFNVYLDETFDKIKDSNFDKFGVQTFLDYFSDDVVNYNIGTSVNDGIVDVLDRNFELKDLRFVNSKFYFDDDGILSISDSVDGFWFDVDQVTAVFEKSLSKLNLAKIKLELIPYEAEIKKEDLEQKYDEVMKKLLFTFTMEDPVYSDDWNIKLFDHKDWVIFNESTDVDNLSDVSSNVNVSISIDEDALNVFVDKEISKWLDVDSEDVNIYYDSDHSVVIEGQGSDGMKINRGFLKDSIELAVNNFIDSFEIPVVKISPNIKVDKELQAKGIKDVLAVGHTSYYGSTNSRVHNIKTAIKRFNGVIVEDGETFSFVKQLGPVNGATGYYKELVIKKEGTIPEYGGGICQVSTTFYRTILFSGLPVVERHPHSYAVSYYSQIAGHGLDATIYIGGPDLKFKNDTGHAILMQAYVKNNYELYVVFYGTKDGRTVEMDGPYLSNYHSPGAPVVIETTTLAPGVKKTKEHSHTGFNAVWYRNLVDKDGVETKETILSKYRAIPSKVLVGIEPHITTEE